MTGLRALRALRGAWPWLAGAGIYGLSLWIRLRDLDAGIALGDATGPWWTALASPVNLRPHAPPYGWGLYPAYAAAATAGSLRGAAAALLALHALSAPLAFAAARALGAAAPAAAAAGLLVALDGGLLDTARSGSEGYLAAIWLGAATLGAAARERRWGPWLACLGLAAAMMNHPYAVTCAPLLLALDWRRRGTWGAALAACVLLAPRISRALSEGAPAAGGDLGPPGEAAAAWLAQGGPGAWVIAAAPLIGLARTRSRPLAMATLLSLGLTAAAASRLDYLRDHHLRLLTVPAVVGLAALPGAWGLAPLAALRAPPAQRPPTGKPQRPGTIGLEWQLAEALVAAAPTPPLLIDGAWISGSPAAEPAALTLDLHLRGWGPDSLGPGGTLALVISAERPEVARLPPLEGLGRVVVRGDRHLVLLAEWSRGPEIAAALAPLSPRLGGAQDAIGVLHPSLPGEALAWWGEAGAAVGPAP